MFLKYSQLVGKLFTELWNNKQSADFFVLLKTIGCSLMLVLSIILIILLTVFVIAGPYKFYGFFLSNINKTLTDELSKANPDIENVHKLNKKVRNRKIAFWSLLIFVYLPIMVPTVLYLLNLITGGIL